MQDDRQVVVHPDRMDLETFSKHMTHRHASSLGGLPELKLREEGPVSQAYRRFHRNLHQLRDADWDHTHGEFVAESRISA